jgi:hypothetical protein
MNMVTVTIYVLFIVGTPAGRNPDIGSFVDSAACTQHATSMNESWVKDHPESGAREPYSCKSLDLVSYSKSAPALAWRKQ